MKRGLIFLLIFLTLFSTSALALEKDCVYYFYGDGCPHCATTESFLNQLNSKYTGLEIHKYEIYYNRSNLNLLQKYFDGYQVPSNNQGIPAIFLDQSYFIGENSITQFLESALVSNPDSLCPTTEEDQAVGVIGDKDPKHLIDTLDFSTVTSASFQDSVNPYALAVLLILLAILITKHHKRKLLITGFVFIFGVKLVYFLFRLGFFNFNFGAISFYFYKTIGVLAILLGLFKIKNHFRETPLWFELSHKKRLKFDKWINRITSPIAAFIIGFAVSLCGLQYMGKQYNIILALLADPATKWAATLLLLYHNLIFILPLVALTLLLALVITQIEEHGRHIKVDVRGDVARKKIKYGKLLHLIIGLVFLTLGILVFLM